MCAEIRPKTFDSPGGSLTSKRDTELALRLAKHLENEGTRKIVAFMLIFDKGDLTTFIDSWRKCQPEEEANA